MKNSMEKSLFIKCQCSSHCFEIEREADMWGENNESKYFNLTFWTYGRSNEILSWKERLRWMWNIFRTGKPWSDGIIIDDDQAKQITTYINKHLLKG